MPDTILITTQQARRRLLERAMTSLCSHTYEDHLAAGGRCDHADWAAPILRREILRLRNLFQAAVDVAGAPKP